MCSAVLVAVFFCIFATEVFGTKFVPFCLTNRQKIMLKNILTITGRPGLYKVVAQSNKGMIIVESLIDKKRFPSFSHEKAVALSDIAMFTEDGEKPLREIFELVKAKEAGKTASVDPKASGAELFEWFESVLPNFDRDHVHPGDVKKLVQWYNLLITSGITDFEEKDETAEKAE